MMLITMSNNSLKKSKSSDSTFTMPDPAIPVTLAPFDGIGCAALVTPDIPHPKGAAFAALSLASAIAIHLHREVVCVDACITHPELINLTAEKTPTLQEQLMTNSNDPQATRISEFLSVIPCSHGGEKDMALLGSQRFDLFIAALRKRFSMVLIMLPPTVLFAGVSRTAKMTDGVAILIDCSRTRWEAASECQRQLVESKVNILGVIMNRRKFYVPAWLYHAI
jgi:protein-tyrosine kinase